MVQSNGSSSSKPGVVFGISNEVVAIVGSVALVGIGAHLLGEWLKPKQRAQHIVEVAHKTDEPTFMEAMYGEAVASATHPEQVHRNRDRVMAAIKQRVPRLQQLAQRATDGSIGPDKIAEGIHGNTEDVLDQLGIPSSPHPSAAPPQLVSLFKNQRKNNLSSQYHIPGGLILDPQEKRWLEHQAMSYAVTTDPVQRVLKREAARDEREAARLSALRQHYAARQQHIAAREMEALGDVGRRRAPSGALQGSVWP